MSTLLTEALRGLGLQPGQTYRTVVDGLAVEVRVLGDESVSSELADQVMLLPWADFPTSSVAIATQIHATPLPLPDPALISPDDEVAE